MSHRVTSPADLFKHEIYVDYYQQMGCGKILNI